MDPTSITLAVISAVVQIANRHMAAHPHVPLTDAMVLEDLRMELADGQSIIAAEFAAKGVMLPD